MMLRPLIVISFVAAVGCGGKSAVDELAALRDRMCDCKTSSCVEDVNIDFVNWAKSQSEKKAEPTEPEQRRIDALLAELNACRARAMGVEVAKSQTDAGTSVTAPPAPPAPPTIDAAPKQAVFDPKAPLFGLDLKEVNGWVPRSPRPDDPYVGFKRPGQVVPIHVFLIETSPETLAAFGKDKALLEYIRLTKIKKISGEKKSPHGWSGVASGKSIDTDLEMQVFVELVRHGPHTLLCSANLTSLMGEPIAEEDARAVCASLYPRP